MIMRDGEVGSSMKRGRKDENANDNSFHLFNITCSICDSCVTQEVTEVYERNSGEALQYSEKILRILESGYKLGSVYIGFQRVS